MAVIVRPLRPDEARLFLDLHGRSIRGLAAAYYPQQVIDAWTVPLTEAFLRSFIANPDNEIRLIAEFVGEPAGIGALVVARSELRACYVVPEAARRGVGTALVREMERLALAHGLEQLELLASLNAEPFYASLGFSADGTTELLMRGQPMAAVKMHKRLSPVFRSPATSAVEPIRILDDE